MTLTDIDFERLIEDVIKGYNEKEYVQNVSEALRKTLGEESKWRSIGNHLDIQVLSELNKYMKTVYEYAKQSSKASPFFESFPNWKKAYESGGHRAYQKSKEDKEKNKIAATNNTMVGTEISRDIIIDFNLNVNGLEPFRLLFSPVNHFMPRLY